ncbi:MAG TPA: type II secretion system F family protein [Anaerolineales bacterium]|nr:type II secretion system F family protein [Anaerolineales bacterium]
MTTSSLPALISLLVTLATGIVAVSIAGAMASRPRRRARAALKERLLPWVRAAGMPRGLRRRWATEAAGQRLLMAGVAWDAGDFAGLQWLLLGAGAFGAAALAASRKGDLLGWFLAAVVAAAAWAGPTVWISLRIDRRQREIDRSLPDFLDRLSLALEAGLGFDVALRRAAERFPGRLGEELRRMLRMLDRGHSRVEAMEDIARRNPSDDLKVFAAAVRQADRLGTSLAKTLRVQSRLLRDRRRRRAQEAGRRLPVLIVFPLVFFFLPALLIVYLAPPLLHFFLGQ